MTIIAFDPGTKTGWAVGDKAQGLRASGMWDFKNNRFSGAGMRYVKFRNMLVKLFANCNSWDTQVYFESVARHNGTAAAHVYGGLTAVLMGYCEERDIPYAGVPVQTIKLSWTGKGNASKAMMIDKCEQLGFKVKDDNEADAVALLYYAANL